MAVYQSNPEQEDDARFVPGGLAHLVMGTRGRMLDARRTPVFVTAVEPSRGCFCVRIEAFEDQGAQWELGLEEIERFQFPRDAPTAGPVAVVFEDQPRREDVDPVRRRTLRRHRVSKGGHRPVHLRRRIGPAAVPLDARR